MSRTDGSSGLRLGLLSAVGLMFASCVGEPGSAPGTGGVGVAPGTGGAGGGATASGATGGLPAAGGHPSTGGSGGLSASGGVSGSGGGSAGMPASSGGASGSGGRTTSGSGGGDVTGGTSGGSGGRGSGGRATGSGGAAVGSGGMLGGGGAPTSTGGAGSGSSGGAGGAGSSYDQLILADGAIAFWAMNKTATEPDLTGKTNSGTYKSGAPAQVALPNGDKAADFNGSSQYLTIPSAPSFSITKTGSLTWEAWIRPDVLQFSQASGDGYIDWMGKCQDYGPTCEWEARMYSTNTAEGRPNRLSAYVFKPSAGLGSAADWQPVDGLIHAATWYHVVGEYTTMTQPSDCMDSSATMGCQSVAKYPGSINIWVNGVQWNHASHGSTGCMCQYGVVPAANNSPLNIGTMSMDAWFPGAVGKVALYDRLLSSAEIATHYKAMTGNDPSGSCRSTCSF